MYYYDVQCFWMRKKVYFKHWDSCVNAKAADSHPLASDLEMYLKIVTFDNQSVPRVILIQILCWAVYSERETCRFK